MRYEKQPGNASIGYYRQISFNQRLNNEPFRVFSEDDWKNWNKKGYVVIRNVVPEENIRNLVRTIWEFEEKDPDDPSTWYRPPHREIEMKELVNSGMVEMYHHQHLWDNRQYQKIHKIFADIWGTEKLWVSIDRCNLNFPLGEKKFKGFIHWDIDTSDPDRRNNVQGVLSLSDTTRETGGFQCVPELFRNYDAWVKTQPADRDPFKPDVTGFEIEQVETMAGDLIIWNSMLAHGIRPNKSDRPRIAQYIAMTPAEEENADLRDWRIRSWKERIPPEGYAFPGDPRNWELTRYPRASLTELGEKLLGMKSW
ncbi:MAG: phytanoyl-CoA dioxygenase family protein [Cyclobacteriaceae bacterium]|nr:phytanoyl-CoA dioxygenase family protein [Cyclobacteriaceae bacterium]